MNVADVVPARKFVLVDDQDVPRATLSIGSSGMVGLMFLDGDGEEEMITVGVSKDSAAPFVMLRKPMSDGRRAGLMISITEEGRAVIHLEDADGKVNNLLTSS